MKLKDKVAIVSGGARGIGAAICRRYAEEGARVVVTDRLGHEAQRLAEEIGNGAFAVPFEVTDRASIDNLVAETVKVAGGIDILVNNAATFDMAPVLEITEESYDTVFAVNGVINTSDAHQKQAIQPLSYGLQQVMAMKPVSFEWSSHPQRGRKIGFLAQDLQPILPEVVADKEWQADENGVMQPREAAALGVYYSDIIPVLTKAIQEQQGQIENLQNENQLLKEKLSGLSAEIEQIKAILKKK